MIVVRVELWSAITGKKTEIARMHITNIGGSTKQMATYAVETMRGRSTEQLDKGTPYKKGIVLGHKRLELHVWHLIGKALCSIGYVG